VSFANPLPWWALILVTAAAAALAWHAYRSLAPWPPRRAVLSTLRFLTLLLLVVVLMRPVARLTEIDSRDVIVPVLVDSSRSMGIEDAEGRRRIDVARELLVSQLLPALEPRFTVELLSFGESLEEASTGSLHATARRSDLGGALAAARERYRGRPVAGYVLLTDGGDTGAALDLAAADGVLPPIYPVPIGSTEVGEDREVLGLSVAEAVLDGSHIDLAVSAVAHGAAGGLVELRLLENGRPLEVRHVTPPPGGGPLREVFQVAPAAGAATIYTVEIPPLPGERVPENNRRSILVQPPTRPRRVLLVEGAPGYEHSFLKRALAGDRGLEVDSVVRKGKNEQGADTYYIQAGRGRGSALADGYPKDAASLFAYDAIVLANVGGDQLTTAQMEATREFVARRGGGLLVLGAQSFLTRGLAGTPIEDALPVELSRRMDTAVAAGSARGTHRVTITDAGFLHPVTRIAATADETRKRWDGLPPLAAAAALGSPRPAAVILATSGGASGTSRPLVAVQRYGEGRTMVFAGEASWRWRMMLPSTDRSYDIFWRQAIRWLAVAAPDPVTVFPSAGGGTGEEFTIRAAVRDASFVPLRDAEVDIRVVGPDGRLEQLRGAADRGDRPDPSLFSARFTPDQPGIYRVTVGARRGGAEAGTAAGAVLVGSADLEMADPRLNLALLERLATATGGEVVRTTDTHPLVAALTARAPAAALSVRRDLWHNAWWLTAIVALLAGEWGLRRRWGLR